MPELDTTLRPNSYLGQSSRETLWQLCFYNRYLGVTILGTEGSIFAQELLSPVRVGITQ
jgi:hypothetical protein